MSRYLKLRGAVPGRVVTGGALFAVVLLLFIASCREAAEDVPFSPTRHSAIAIDGYTVPVFASAAEQLNYTRSWFADSAAKRAALQGFITLYPGEKRSCGLAALDLAYLHLGEDYRFSPQHAGFAAIKAYKDILREYEMFPDISAKAYWYIGWIYNDLLHDPEKGGEYYRLVVRDYPEEQVSLLSPAPWVSIIYPDDDTMQTFTAPPNNHWAALALVEMIRHSEDGEAAWEAFSALWREYRSDAATGIGLSLILKRRLHLYEALVMARDFLENDYGNVHLLGDIQQEVNAIHDAGGGL